MKYYFFFIFLSLLGSNNLFAQKSKIDSTRSDLIGHYDYCATSTLLGKWRPTQIQTIRAVHTTIFCSEDALIYPFQKLKNPNESIS